MLQRVIQKDFANEKMVWGSCLAKNFIKQWTTLFAERSVITINDKPFYKTNASFYN